MNRAALLLISILATPAHAIDWPFAEAPYAYIGIERQTTATNNGYGVFCRDGGIDTANIGLGQVLAQRDHYTLAAEWRHHSCITQYHDRNVYDAIGVTLKINLWIEKK